MRSSWVLIFVSLLFIALFTTACDQPLATDGNNGVVKASDYPSPDWQEIPSVLPEMVKGYELYSWQVGEAWLYTLITGTNRSKTIDEITSTTTELDDGFIKITVASADDLATLIKRLPAGVYVTWNSFNPAGQEKDDPVMFTYPPAETLESINKIAAEQGVNLHTLTAP